MIGQRGYDSESDSAQTPHADAWRAMAKRNNAKEEPFLALKGQALGPPALRNLVAEDDGTLRPSRFLKKRDGKQTARSTGTARPKHPAPSLEAPRMHP